MLNDITTCICNETKLIQLLVILDADRVIRKLAEMSVIHLKFIFYSFLYVYRYVIIHINKIELFLK